MGAIFNLVFINTILSKRLSVFVASELKAVVIENNLKCIFSISYINNSNNAYIRL